MLLLIIYMYEQGLALNNEQRLICHKTRTNKPLTEANKYFYQIWLLLIKLFFCL